MGGPEEEESWLNLALNEGNLLSLLAFFQNQLSEDEVPPEAIDRVTKLQSPRMETALARVEEEWEARPSPSEEDASRWALRLAGNFEEEVFAQALKLLFRKAPVATRALRERNAAHFLQLVDIVSRRTLDPEHRHQVRRAARSRGTAQSPHCLGTDRAGTLWHT